VGYKCSGVMFAAFLVESVFRLLNFNIIGFYFLFNSIDNGSVVNRVSPRKICELKMVV
jgi:hypothetical protein